MVIGPPQVFGIQKLFSGLEKYLYSVIGRGVWVGFRATAVNGVFVATVK